MSVSFLATTVVFCNNNVGSGIGSPSITWKLPTRHLDGDGRRRGCSPSGASSRDWRIPVDTLLQRANVGTRSKAHPPLKNPHRLSLCTSWWAARACTTGGLYVGFMGTSGSYGLSLISPNLGVSPIYLAARRRIQAPYILAASQPNPSHGYTRFTFSPSGGLPCCSRSSLSRALIQVHRRRRARRRRSRLGALG